MCDKSDIRFLFDQSPSGNISGVAFKGNGDIIASYKLEVEGCAHSMQERSWSSMTLKIVSEETQLNVYDVFDEVLSKYGEKDSGSWTGAGRICSHWRIRNNQVKNALREIGETLQSKTTL